MFTKMKYAAPTILAVVALCVVKASPLWSLELTDQCPVQSIASTIEVLTPGLTYQGNTCGAANSMEAYIGVRCYNPGVKYPGQDNIYKVVLHEGNNVGFKLEMQNTADLAIALVKSCGKGDSCIRSPKDYRGPVSENIEQSRYDAGIYYLYIDSRKAADCGSYALKVFGVNPTPDLNLDIIPDPTAIAGADLTYKLSVRNNGQIEANNVNIIHTLPAGVTFVASDPRCSKPDSSNTIVCAIPSLAPGLGLPPVQRAITVHVKPDTRKAVILEAKATLDEGDPTPNRKSLAKKITTKIDLSFTNSFPELTTAGTSTTYGLTLANAGPSDATDILVAVDLPRELFCMPETSGCTNGKRITYAIDRIQVGSHKTQSIKVNVKPSALGHISHNVSVIKAAEFKPNTAVSAIINTKARRVADMAVTLDKPSPDTRAAGDKLSYQITVENKGPSDSAGATVTDKLPPGLKFLSSSSNCSATEDMTFVTCVITGISAGSSKTVTFDGRIDSSLDPTTLVNRAMVQAKDNATDPIITSEPVKTQVFVQADMLAQIEKVERIPWTLPATLGNVKAGENLLYTVRAVNSGLSDSRGGVLQDELPNGLAFISSPDGCFATDRTVNCPVPALKAGEEAIRRFVVGIAPSKSGPTGNKVCINSQIAEHDPQGGNNCAEDTSTKVGTEADLALTLNDSPDAVHPGIELTYTISVKNEGPSNASAVSVDLDGTPIEFGGVAAGAVERRVVKVIAPNERGIVKVEAHVHADTPDPNDGNDSAETATTVATQDDADLALALSVDAEAAVAGRPLTYKLTLANQGFSTTGETDVSIQFSQEVSVAPPDCCRFGPLAPGASETRQITAEVGSAASGSLLATADILQADALNPDNNSSSIEIPVVQTSRSADLCASWSVRFLRGQPAGTSTDLLFFVPDTPGGVVATGRVFTEAGDFVQMVSVASSMEEFRRPTLALLAGSGSIEWTFRKGLVGERLVGSMAAVHTRAGAEVKIPGFCRRPGRIGAHALVLPSFQVDPAVNTYVAIRNETDDQVNVRITYSGLSEELRQQTLTVAGHGVSTVNLRRELGSGSGSLEIEALNFSDGQPVDALSGDFIQVGPDGLTGSALERKPD